ncbi:MAG TPA: endonuclease/exonuclease/phosphatase family protein [Pseudomonadales bacterium]
MIVQFETVLRQLRRWFSRSEWVLRFLGLKKTRQTASVRGLLFIQIDGLSHNQFQQALANGNLPFLSSLLKAQRFKVHHLYSGLPSSTPAVQGELFYGVKTSVPAFSFVDKQSGQVMEMFLPASAAAIERKLAFQGEPLLSDGAMYADNFTGGAAETHFCPSSFGWGGIFEAINPLLLIFLLLSNLYSLLRLVVLLVLELIIAVVDFFRGLIAGRDFLKELTFIPARVFIAILIRELVVIGAKIDVARGLPIIHLNLLGYDEQAHRRGPSSRFAHWTLQGIDDAVARLWRATKRSTERDYDVWIYSDHGQENTESYIEINGQSIQQAVSALLGEKPPGELTNPDRGEQLKRVNLLGERFSAWWLKNIAAHSMTKKQAPIVTAMGPIGFVYHPQSPLSEVDSKRFAEALVKVANVPMVLLPVLTPASGVESTHRVWAFTEFGTFQLPKDKALLLGAEHPFLDELTDDLINLCKHPDAGDFILCAWHARRKPMSFPMESGAHGGPGFEETHGFALLPGDTVLPATSKNYLRPLDMRAAALHLLGREEIKASREFRRKSKEKTLRVMTYNVHSCIGMDRKLSPERIARVIAQYSPDVVALQELDVGRERTESIDQAHLIAKYLEMEFHFHPALHLEEERYGDAILTDLPLRLIKAGPLPGLDHKPLLEPRGALWVAVELDGVEIQIINTHLGLRKSERLKQIKALLGAEWLGHPDCLGPRILCGDFNDFSGSAVCKAINEELSDAQELLAGHKPQGTFFGRFPQFRIDHVFVDSNLEVLGIDIPGSALEQVASDHLPLIAELKIKSGDTN